MNKKYIYALSLAALMSAGLASCVSDDSSYADESRVPELSISGLTETMPVMNINLGERCVITPDVKYSSDQSNLSYTWSVGDYTSGSKGTLTEVSSDASLDYLFTKGGAYYVHLTVTDGNVGLVQEYQINVNRTFENGFVLVSNDESNNGNLAFIKTMSAEEIAAGTEQVYMEHCLSRMNEGVADDHLISAVTSTVTWPSTITRLLVSTEDAAYFLDPNTFTIISEIDYADTQSGFKATNFYPDSTYPCAYDASKKKFVHLDLTYMFGFEYSYFQGVAYDQMWKYPYSMWGGVYYNVYCVNYPSTVALYNVGAGTFHEVASDPFAGQKVLTCFPNHTMVSYSYTNYILTQSTSDNSVHLSTVKLAYASGGYQASLASTSDVVTTENSAIPVQGCEVISSSTYRRFYYAVDNAVYVLLLDGTYTLPEKSEYAIKFPAGEEVTYMVTNDSDGELYVATYSNSTKRGSLYVYNLADVKVDNQNTIQPKAAHKNIADKITSFFKKTTI